MRVFFFSFLIVLGALVIPGMHGNYAHAAVCVTDCVQTGSVVVKLMVTSSSTPFTPPYIVLNGASIVNLIVGDSYFELGATATDTEGDDLSDDVVITGGPVNTAVVSTTTLVYTVTDPYNMLSASTTRMVIVAPAGTPPTPPSPPPSSGGSGSVANPAHNFSVTNLIITTGTSTATAQWSTNVPTVSTLAWGTNPDATAGSISEVTAKNAHAFLLENLQPGTTYFIIVRAYTAAGLSNYFLASFTTKSLTQIPPPENVTGLSATLGNQPTQASGVVVSWKNPDDNFSSILVTRGTRFFPRDPDEGYIVYQGKGNSAVDINAAPDGVYYYTVFTKNSNGNYSSGVATKYIPLTTPASTNQNVTVHASSSPPLFGGIVEYLATTTIGQIIFVQGNKNIPVGSDGTVSIVAGQSLIVDIPPRLVSGDTEEVLLEIDSDYFIFKKLSNGWLQTIVPANFSYKPVSPFSINFLSVGSEYRLSGTFIVQKIASPGVLDKPWVALNFWSTNWFWILWILLVILIVWRGIWTHK